MTIRLLRLFRSEKGIWRYEIERNGEVRWSSLRTRDEKKARAHYDKLRSIYGSNPPHGAQADRPPAQG
jgi:hypothetical protein